MNKDGKNIHAIVQWRAAVNVRVSNYTAIRGSELQDRDSARAQCATWSPAGEGCTKSFFQLTRLCAGSSLFQERTTYVRKENDYADVISFLPHQTKSVLGQEATFSVFWYVAKRRVGARES
jgi:hypothetical protein